MNWTIKLLAGLFLCTAVQLAHASYATDRVFAYECAQVEKQTPHLKCNIEDNGVVVFKWDKKQEEVPKDEGKHAEYVMLKLVLSYYEYGGTHFFIRMKGSEKIKKCGFLKNEYAAMKCRFIEE